MEISDQDSKILREIMNDQDISMYKISKNTGISRSQVRYRIDKLKQSKIVKVCDDGGFILHPIFHSDKAMKKIIKNLTNITEIIEDTSKGEISNRGIESILSYIVRHTHYFKEGIEG